MRVRLVFIIYLLVRSQFLGGEPDVYRVAVHAEAEANKAEGEELAQLIADELRREKDVVIDENAPNLTISCGVMTHTDGERLVASVAFMIGDFKLLQHFPLAADSLQNLAHQVVLELDKRELNDWRQRRIH